MPRLKQEKPQHQRIKRAQLTTRKRKQLMHNQSNEHLNLVMKTDSGGRGA
jgi:hypothetical protein